ncbi:hypothetical protein ACTG9Q_29225 [Actinokineospora sp. 24-640]
MPIDVVKAAMVELMDRGGERPTRVLWQTWA